jgi:hypothetical protein
MILIFFQRKIQQKIEKLFEVESTVVPFDLLHVINFLNWIIFKPENKTLWFSSTEDLFTFMRVADVA